MRISTKQLFDNGTLNIQRNQFEQFKTQNQISTGRRNLTPADDPVAAAQTLVTEQHKSVNAQYQENQGAARTSLGLVEGELGSLTDLLQSIRERAVQLGNAALTDKERGFISEELNNRFQDLLSIGNAQNGQGQYLFSGYQGSTRPFALNGTTGLVNYAGDTGERLLQVDASRQIDIAANGSDVFMAVDSGNGTFEVKAGAANAGTGLADGGSVIDLAKWNAAPAALQPRDYRIAFQVDSAGVLKYNLTDASGTNSLLTGAAVGNVNTAPEWRTFTSGQRITFDGLLGGTVDLGVQVTVNGTPVAGDSFAVTASAGKSLFDTVHDLVALAGTSVGSTAGASTRFTSKLGEGLANLDQSLNNISRVRARVGTSLSELDALGSAADDRALQLDTRLSELKDLDYAEAISRLSRQQMQLEAAQKSFMKITGLNLFNLL